MLEEPAVQGGSGTQLCPEYRIELTVHSLKWRNQDAVYMVLHRSRSDPRVN